MYKITEGPFLPSASRLAKEHSFFEGSQACPICPSGKSKMKMKLSMDHWYSDTDLEKMEVLGAKLVPLSSPPTKISQALVSDRARASAER